jgi:ABC-type lipoprotein release transport system permease subunit
VWAWLRLDLHRRWRSLTVLALLVAVASGVVMAATAGARRGGSAVDRLHKVTSAGTVLVGQQPSGFDWDQVRRLPGVAAVGTFIPADDLLYLDGVETSDEEAYWSRFTVDDTEMTRTVERPAVLAGRLADQTRIDEAMVTASFSARHHLGVGDTVTARLFTPQQADASLVGNARAVPHGPRQPLRIVGVVRSPVVNTALNPSAIMTTLAFTTAYRANLLGSEGHGFHAGAVRLTRGEAGLADFQRRLADVTKRDDISFLSLGEEARKAKAMTGFERNALLLFALTALVASAVVLGQAAARYAAASAADIGVLRALGMTVGQAAAATAAGPTLAAAVGVLIAAPAAVAASGVFPIGTAANYEPDPGTHVDLAVLAGTAAAVVLVVVAAATLGAWRALARARSAATPRRSVVAAAAYRLGLPVPVVFGTRLALEPGRGRTAVPVRPALLGAVMGVLGVLAALTFHAGVADAAGNPQRFGQTYQIEGWIGENGRDFKDPGPLWRALAADPDVVAVNDTRIGVANANGLPVDVFGHQPGGAARPLPVVTLSGRMPTAPDEIALAPDTAHETGAQLGDTLTFAGRGRAAMRVTGIAFVPSGGYGGYAKGAWTTGGGFRALFPDGSFTYHFGHVALREGADAEAVSERILTALGGPWELRPARLPREIQQLRNVRVLPLALGGFLAGLALAATGHALATAVRRRRTEIAILRAFGLTRRQSRLIVVTQATILVAVGLAFGVPVGVALGRTVWRAVAHSMPLFYVPPIAVLALVLVGPVALLVGNLLAALPAGRAASLRVGDVLRAE